MTLLERLNALATRREMEGIYTDAKIADEALTKINQLENALASAVKEIQRLRNEIDKATQPVVDHYMTSHDLKVSDTPVPYRKAIVMYPKYMSLVIPQDIANWPRQYRFQFMETAQRQIGQEFMKHIAAEIFGEAQKEPSSEGAANP